MQIIWAEYIHRNSTFILKAVVDLILISLVTFRLITFVDAHNFNVVNEREDNCIHMLRVFFGACFGLTAIYALISVVPPIVNSSKLYQIG